MQINFLCPTGNFQSFSCFAFSAASVLILTSDLCLLAAPSDFCQDAYMKHFFLGYLSALLIPTL